MRFFRLLLAALVLWIRREGDQHAAALAYFTPFALTPLIIFSISIVGYIFGSERVIALLLNWGTTLDPEVTGMLFDSVQNFTIIESHYYWPILATAFLSLMIFITINSLMAALHKVWDVVAVGWSALLQKIWRAILFIAVIQCYLVCMIVLSDMYTNLAKVSPTMWWDVLEAGTSLLATTLLLAITYGLLAFKAPPLKARFYGALVASLLLIFSRELVAFHFATAPVQTLFGAAGFLITLLVWVYVIASVVIYGAAYAKVYDDSKRRLP